MRKLTLGHLLITAALRPSYLVTLPSRFLCVPVPRMLSLDLMAEAIHTEREPTMSRSGNNPEMDKVAMIISKCMDDEYATC